MTTQAPDDMTDTLDAIADPTRLRILELLSAQDRCVCHLVEDLEMRQSVISHHVGVLRRSGLVSSYPHPRDRRWMYYRLNRDMLHEIGIELISIASEAGYNPERLPCPVDLEDSDE